jgi:hypothetical protein
MAAARGQRFHDPRSTEANERLGDIPRSGDEHVTSIV